MQRHFSLKSDAAVMICVGYHELPSRQTSAATDLPLNLRIHHLRCIPLHNVTMDPTRLKSQDCAVRLDRERLESGRHGPHGRWGLVHF